MTSRALTGLLAVLLGVGVALPATASANAPDPADPPLAPLLAQLDETVDGALEPLTAPSDESRDLTTQLRGRATQAAARPVPGGEPAWTSHKCVGGICVHYVTTPGNPDRTTPAHVNDVLATVQQVRQKYISAGYRPTVGDGTRGNPAGVTGTNFDVYIGQLGNQGYYGYCTSDDPRTAYNALPHISTWAYCALDNDYTDPAFGTRNTPKELLQVTVAHEYFHAVQFGYDYGEDGWFMEATAVWAEDEAYDSINDNRGYLRLGPLGRPSVSMTAWGEIAPYGSWIFFRWLSERFPRSQGGMATIVRDAWQRASLNGAGEYSLQAVAGALKGRRMTWSTAVQRFAMANRRVRTWYDEGAGYPAQPVNGALRLSLARPGAAIRKSLDHLATATYRIKPSDGMRRGWRLRVRADLTARVTGANVWVSVTRTDGSVARTRVRTNRYGIGSWSAPFNSRAVRYVEVTLVNASRRFRCNRGQGWEAPCQGTPLDDNRMQNVSLRAVRR